jgi:AcrR family transcriptional regulator
VSTSANSRRAERGFKPRKGDEREQAILDTAERLMTEHAFAELTVEAIARGAGIGRSALYFYFGSKQEVLAALVARTTAALNDGAGRFFTDSTLPVDVALERAMQHTAAMWREHGAVARAAVEQSHAIPAVREMWEATVERFARSAATLIAREAPPGGDALVVARALIWMTERSFYALSRSPHDADDERRVVEALTLVWTRSVGTAGAQGPR